MQFVPALTGLLAGSEYGYVSQRGAFCMNSGCRAVATERNTTKVKAYVLAIALQMILVPVVFVAGFSAPTQDGPITASKVSPRDASQRFAGGLGLGTGASIAAGCTLGHGLTGVPLLAPGSIVAIFAGIAITPLWGGWCNQTTSESRA